MWHPSCVQADHGLHNGALWCDGWLLLVTHKLVGIKSYAEYSFCQGIGWSPGQMWRKSYCSSFLMDSICLGTEWKLYTCTVHQDSGPSAEQALAQDLPHL